jgi:multidrug transporter EmrE-like cation transporter
LQTKRTEINVQSHGTAKRTASISASERIPRHTAAAILTSLPSTFHQHYSHCRRADLFEDRGRYSTWRTRYGFLVSLWIWTGISAILLSLFSWLYALKSVPLIVAFNLAATNHILVAIGAWAFLGEKITQQRWLGISLVALGAFFIARSSSCAEDKL